MPEDLCLIAVHAHPDDEASKGAATVARYADEGVRTVLVTCTGGEAGEILNAGADSPEARADLAAVRRRELGDAVAAIGFSTLHLLGYRDSGMPDSEWNRHPDAFANAPLEESVGRLVAIIRAERPQVVLTYADDHTGYPHPDHIRVHDVSIPAFEAAGDPDRYPDAGEPWQPLKLYYMGFSRAGLEAVHAAYLTSGLESPYGEWIKRREDQPDRFTTRIEVGAHLPRRRAALLAHRTQIDPDSFWLRLDDERLRATWPYEEFILARSLVDTGVSPGELEFDLFAGVRESARR